MTTDGPALGSTPAPGWYPYGVAGRTGEWDGEAWTSLSRAETEVEAPPAWHHNVFDVVRRTWFWIFLGGYIVTIFLGVLAGNDAKGVGWYIALTLSSAIVMAAVVLIFEPHARFSQLKGLRLIVAWGIVSGVVAVGLAKLVEGWLEPTVGLPFAADLWLSGFVEETAKLLVPILLWLFAARLFRDPRAGFLLALVSGATFGAFEVALYTTVSGEHAPAMMAVGRPMSDVTHSLYTAIAATMIWLAAHRAGRLVTLAGFLGYLGAVALHSVHDGVGSFSEAAKGTHNQATENLSYDSLGAAFLEGLGLVVVSLLYALLCYVILRHFAARELTPPNAIGTNPPHWRPRLATWGAPKVANPVGDRAAGERAAGERAADAH